MKHLFLIILFFISTMCSAQINMDSLWTVWRDDAQADSNRLKAIKNLAWEARWLYPDSAIDLAQLQYDLAESTGNMDMIAEALNTQGVSYFSKGDNDKAIEYFKRSLKIREDIDDKMGIALSLGNIGLIYYNQGDNAEAIDYFIRGLKVKEEIGDQKGIAKALMTIGVVYKDQGNLTKAMDYYTRSLKIKEEIGDQKGIAHCLNNIGLIYQNQEDMDKALDYYNRSLAIKEEIGDQSGIATTLSNIGLIYADQGEMTKAMEHSTRSMKIYEEIGDRYGFAFSLRTVGSIYFDQGENTKAMDFFTRSLEISEELGDKSGTASVLNDIGNVYADQGNFNKAVSFEHRALLIAQEIGNVLSIKSASESLYEAYKAMGQSAKALEMYELCVSMNDSLESEENKRAIIQQEFKYNYEKEKLADSLAQTESRLKSDLAHQEEISQKNQTRNILLGTSLLILLAAGGLFNRVRHIKKSNAKLEMAKKRAEDERNRAERSEQFKKQFLANMSHEIRTPMNAVLGMTSLTLDTDLTEKQTKYLTSVKKSSENLLVIINDILDLSKLEAGKMELEKIPFSISEQFEQVHDTLKFKAEEKALTFETKIDENIPDVLKGDPSRLNQILINLAGNAIKFTEKGKVSVSVTAREQKNEKITLKFKVTDTGIGIPKDKAGKLFSAFQQVEAGTSRKYGGTGLGLSISQTLVELQGGSIQIESEEGRGSTFYFSIPYEVATEKEVKQMLRQHATDSSNLTGLRVLIAEDNELNQIVIEDTLKVLIKDVYVDMAENGKITLDKLNQTAYDIVLMDVNMPEMDGHEAARAIRKLDSGKKDIPIIALTASVLSSDIKKCLESGMNDYIPKPFRREELLKTLSKYYHA